MRWCILALALVLAACTVTPSSGADGGSSDAGIADAGIADAGPTDAGAFDGGDARLPPIPLGLDAYRRWTDWPVLRIGMRAVMRSTYDRAGGNEGSDASHFLREDSSGRFVAAEIAGPGALVFFRA